MPQRVSLLLAVTTNPANLSAASAHSGGWSESHWTGNLSNINPIISLAQARSPMLPTQCSIVGYRIQTYVISGNKLLPGGTTSGRLQLGGSFSTDLNLPQDSLQEGASAVGAVNSTRFTLRAIPDSQISNGEYQPTTNFATLVNTYNQQLILQQWGFVGRVKSGLSARVMKIDPVTGIVTLNQAVGGAAGTDFLRLVRVIDSGGNPVKGAFAISAIAGVNYTCPGLIGINVPNPSGTARIDALALYSYGTVTPSRAVSRRIGRPFQQYRGRRSKTRAA